MSLNSLSSLCFSAPVSFFLRLYTRSVEAVIWTGFFSVLIYISVKGWIIYLILLESRDILV